jgi:hypothetical protein
LHVPKARIYNEVRQLTRIRDVGWFLKESKKLSYTINDVESDAFNFIEMVNYRGRNTSTRENTIQTHSTGHPSLIFT